MENRYKKYNPAMLADFCRNLKHAIIEIFHKSRKYEKLMSITDTLSLTLTAKYRKKTGSTKVNISWPNGEKFYILQNFYF